LKIARRRADSLSSALLCFHEATAQASGQRQQRQLSTRAHMPRIFPAGETMHRCPSIVLVPVMLCFAAGCDVPETREFETTLAIRDAQSRRPIQEAYLVRVLRESPSRLDDAESAARERTWTHTIEIFPVHSGSEFYQPALKKVQYSDVMHSEINDLAFTYSLWSQGYAARLFTPEEVQSGTLMLTAMEDLSSSRDLWRMCEYFEREVLPFLEVDAPGRRPLLKIVRSQLVFLKNSPMASLGVEGRLRRIDHALAETIDPPAPNESPSREPL
jgi:hypothetical protein